MAHCLGPSGAAATVARGHLPPRSGQGIRDVAERGRAELQRQCDALHPSYREPGPARAASPVVRPGATGARLRTSTVRHPKPVDRHRQPGSRSGQRTGTRCPSRVRTGHMDRSAHRRRRQDDHARGSRRLRIRPAWPLLGQLAVLRLRDARDGHVQRTGNGRSRVLPDDRRLCDGGHHSRSGYGNRRSRWAISEHELPL
jgi:hypothetical protein